MRVRLLVRCCLVGWVLALSGAWTAVAEESCRVAFDLGSSGIRAGASNQPETARADIDYLSPLWAGRGLEETWLPTREALRRLPEQAGFSPECSRVAGGFSAWRLALLQDVGALVRQLTRLHGETGVAILVIPQLQEGAYGYLGARQLLGDQLRGSHVLDIGGGSLQIAGESATYGEALGQKVWHRLLCQELRNAEASPCDLQPMTGDELLLARQLAAENLAGIAASLPVGRVTMTAISRPVSRGVLPAVLRWSGREGGHAFSRADLALAIEGLARLRQDEMRKHLGTAFSHSAYLLSDMLLVEGILAATASDDLQVAEIDLTNLPGLLADDRAYLWQSHYGCYLERLTLQGIAAYRSDPASCP